MRLLLPLLVLLVSGCAGAGAGLGTAEGYPNHPREEVLARTAAASAAVYALAADGRIAIETPALRERATFSLRTRFRDSLTVVLRGPLGIEGGRALVAGDALLAIDRVNRAVYTGDAAALGRFVPGGATAEAAARALAALVVPETALPWTLAAADGLYRLAVDTPGGGRREIDVDPRFWGVVGLRVFDGAGALAGEVRASEHARVPSPAGPVVLARRVEVVAPAGRLTLEHRTLAVNPRGPLLRVVPPADYPVVALDALLGASPARP